MIIKFHSKMKALFVLTFLAAISYSLQDMLSEEYTKKIKEKQNDCKKKFTSISDEDFNKMVNNQKMPSTQDEKCFSFCYAKEMGYMDADNKMSLTAVKESNKQKYQSSNLPKADQVAETCVAEANKETDPCETATKYFLCISTQSKNADLQLPSYYKPS